MTSRTMESATVAIPAASIALAVRPTVPVARPSGRHQEGVIDLGFGKLPGDLRGGVLAEGSQVGTVDMPHQPVGTGVEGAQGAGISELPQGQDGKDQFQVPFSVPVIVVVVGYREVLCRGVDRYLPAGRIAIGVGHVERLLGPQMDPPVVTRATTASLSGFAVSVQGIAPWSMASLPPQRAASAGKAVKIRASSWFL